MSGLVNQMGPKEGSGSLHRGSKKGGPKAPDNQRKRWQAGLPSTRSVQEPILPHRLLGVLFENCARQGTAKVVKLFALGDWAEQIADGSADVASLGTIALR